MDRIVSRSHVVHILKERAFMKNNDFFHTENASDNFSRFKKSNGDNQKKSNNVFQIAEKMCPVK